MAGDLRHDLANQLSGNLSRYLPSGAAPGDVSNAQSDLTRLQQLSEPVREGYGGAFAASIDTVFLAAVPFAAVALSWFLREVPQRKTTGLGESYAMPKADDSLREIERALTILASREGQRNLYRQLATQANVDLPPPECWLLLRLGEHEDLTPDEVATRLTVPEPRLHAHPEVLR